MIKITLPGSIRSKKNSKQIVPLRSSDNKPTWFQFYFKVKGGFRKWMYAKLTIQPSAAYLAWERDARRELMLQLEKDGNFPWQMTTEPVHVCATFYYKGNRPDLSGAAESIGDCLQGFLWKNDRQIESWDGSRLVHDKENPRTEVCVEVI